MSATPNAIAPCQDHHRYGPEPRRATRQVEIGGIKVGGDAPVVVQSMTNTDTSDVQSTAKQVAELQHELETLQRRQAALEEQQLEIMERREELQGEQNEELALIDALQGDLTSAQVERDQALVSIDESRKVAADRRKALLDSVTPELAEMYEKQRKLGGPGAGLLQGSRCGACRIDLDRGELSRVSAAAPDDVLRCPECGAILVRVKDFRAGETGL